MNLISVRWCYSNLRKYSNIFTRFITYREHLENHEAVSKQGHHNRKAIPAETAKWGHSGDSGSRACRRNIFSSRMMSAHMQRMSSWTYYIMCFIDVSCLIDFQSASGVGGLGHRVHRTWIPPIISSGATSKANSHTVLEL